MRERIHEGGETLDEYLLRLEAYSKELEAGISHMQSEQKKSQEAISRLQDEIAWQKDLEARLKAGLDDLQDKNIELQSAMEEEKLAFIKQRELLLAQHRENINDTVRQWQERVGDITARYNEEKNNCHLKLQEAERNVSEMKDQQIGRAHV